MTATVSPESKPTSRRALLAGALGGLGALAASAIGRPAITTAEGENIQVGGQYSDAQSLTFLQNQSNDNAVFSVESTGAGQGVIGTSNSSFGVTGNSSSNIGVYGSSGSGSSVRGTSSSSSGVYGSSGSGYGVYGQSSSNAGVVGQSSPSYGVYGSGGSAGVYGVSSSANGVEGVSTASAHSGVYGHNESHGYGVAGRSNAAPLGANGIYAAAVFGDNTADGVGVWARSLNGIGLLGESGTSGFAGYFAGKVYVSKFQEMPEISAPAAPGANKARLFVRDNGSGKTQLCVRFNTGGVLVIKTQP